MKKKNTYSSIIIIILIILISAYYFSRDEEIVYSEPQWNCSYLNNKWNCTVSFEVINKTHTQQVRKVSIRGVKVPKDGKFSSLKIYGEKIFDIDMNPKERLEVIENLLVDRKPNKINVNIWK